jgi:voltage-dependent potassium channel beta subunit
VEYRFLGRSGLQVSALSLGAWVTFSDQMDEDRALACMREAYEHGVNFFDNAEIYAEGQAEEIMGRAIARAGWRRSDLVVSTKIFWGGRGPNDRGLSRKHIVEGTEAALARLGMRYVDLIFCHRPDPDTPMAETVRAMSYIVDTGRAFYWGTSEWSAEQIRDAWHIARRERLVPPTMEQPQYNLFFREKVEKEYARLYDDIGLGTTTWSPLASGLLTGKYNDGVPGDSRLALEGYAWLRDMVLGEGADENIAKVRKLADVAADLGCTLAQLGIAWCLRNPHVSTVITGASRPEQVRENMQALALVPQLTATVLERIENIVDNRPPADPNFRSWRD